MSPGLGLGIRLGRKGRKGGFTGQLAELLLFNTPLTAQQHADVAAYLAHWTA